MGKKLVGRENVQQYICHERKTICVDQTMILSPGAKDYLREQGVSVVYGGPKGDGSKPSRQPQNDSESDLNSAIQMILKRDYAITDSAQIAEVTKQVLDRLGADQ